MKPIYTLSAISIKIIPVMDKLILLFIIALLYSCQPTNDPEQISNKVRDKKEKITTLRNEVAQLEKELLEVTGKADNNKVLVETIVIEPQEFNHYFEASGTVEALNEAYISPEISGQIKNIYVSEGERVDKGELLIKLNTSILENNIGEVRTSLELATTVFNKQKQLWDKNIGSEMQFLEARNRKKSLESKLKTLESQLDMAYIRSPLKGVVDEIFLKEGELATPGVQLMQVVNLDVLYINADISENYLPDIRKGEVAYIRFPSYPEIQLEEPIRRIGQMIEPQNRTFTIQFKIDNRQEKLKPNILSIIQINDYNSGSAFVVPSQIMKEDRNGTYLYRAVTKGSQLIAEKAYVEPGKSYKNETEILQGISTGDTVVVKGYNIISDGTEIKIR